jgi:hypothetical protein
VEKEIRYRIKFLAGTVKEFKTLVDANLEDADLRGSNLRNADLTNANLKYANLEDADLTNANLTNADLRGADLTNADLRYTNLTNTELITFNLGKDPAFYCKGILRIGCDNYSIEHWVNSYEEIGKENDYSKEEIELYGNVINLLYLKYLKY